MLKVSVVPHRCRRIRSVDRVRQGLCALPLPAGVLAAPPKCIRLYDHLHNGDGDRVLRQYKFCQNLPVYAPPKKLEQEHTWKMFGHTGDLEC